MDCSLIAFLLAIVYLGLKIAGVAFPLGNPTVVITVSFFSGILQLLIDSGASERVARMAMEMIA